MTANIETSVTMRSDKGDFITFTKIYLDSEHDDTFRVTYGNRYSSNDIDLVGEEYSEFLAKIREVIEGVVE